MLFLLALLGCFNDCSYFERCDGDTLLVCGGGPDQSFGRTENPVPCEAPNDVCVEVGDENATCAHAADACDAGAAPRCDGEVLVTCDPFSSALGLLGDGTDVSFEQAEDCAASGMVCGTDEAGVAACVAG